jgi:hypothetical protein
MRRQQEPAKVSGPWKREAGQGLVEFAAIVSLFTFLLLGILEFGFVFDHALLLSYASREGARVGAALANGGGPLGCGSGQSPNAASVDPLIVAAVERVLTQPGSPIALSRIAQIRIYQATASGGEVAGKVNVWVYAPGGGPVVDGKALDFKASGTAGWPACARQNGLPPDSLGVSLQYTYQFVTPLGAVARFFGGGMGPSLLIGDRTVMALNPTQ